MIQEAKAGKLNGIFLMALFACASFYIGEWNFFREISFSPMIIGIILGMIYANTLRMNLRPHGLLAFSTVRNAYSDSA